MQHNRPSPPYPPPDVHPAWTQSRLPPQPSPVRPTSQQNHRVSPHPHPHPYSHASHPVPSSQREHHTTAPPSDPEFLIIGLFALRLTQRLISALDPYPHRTSDINWLTNFLAPYHQSYDLAKITGATRDSYLRTYPQIVARMKTQRQFPVHFMALNPVAPQRGEALARRGGLTDSERLEIVDFADAAREWGSVVRVPHEEAERMLELADRRRVADLERRLDDGLGVAVGVADRGH